MPATTKASPHAPSVTNLAATTTITAAAATATARSSNRAVEGRPAAHNSSPAAQLAAAHLLIDQGLLSQAEMLLSALSTLAPGESVLLASARIALADVLHLQSRDREALAAVAIYEAPPARSALDPVTAVAVRVRLAVAYLHTGDYPKAIALLDTTLREADEHSSDGSCALIYLALARVYRSINEFAIAYDYSQQALTYARQTGDWRSLVDVYYGLANAAGQAGDYQASLAHFEHALQLIGTNPAPHLSGMIHTNMAAICWHLRRPQDGVRHCEHAIADYEPTELTKLTAYAYNNLGLNLVLTGEWTRADMVYRRALALATEVDPHGRTTASVLESYGELLMLRGDLEEAAEHLEQAVELSAEDTNRWYPSHNLRTLSRCCVALDDAERARTLAQQAIVISERIGDHSGICEAHLRLAEAYLLAGDFDDCAAQLKVVVEHTTSNVSDLAITGEAQRIHGLLSLAHGDSTLAAHHFGRSAAIFELLGDRYRTALAEAGLGRAYAVVQAESAGEYLGRAAAAFREFGARLDLARTEEAVALLKRRQAKPASDGGDGSGGTPAPHRAQLLTLRLAEASVSRDLLLRELVTILHQETAARRIMIVEAGEDTAAAVRIVAAYPPPSAVPDADTTRLAADLHAARTAATRAALAAAHSATIIALPATNAAAATLFIKPRAAATQLATSALLHTLLRVVELGMEVCAARARKGFNFVADTAADAPQSGASVLPGFIHSSPAMTHLIEEVQRIRSSDATVLITGESGTGKELVAKAVHALSARRLNPFVPFNCTAIPKELAEAYLFGYRKGAFTGAVTDSPGIIRSAEGGTLFLDEIGDLPADVQPKLLRFLQEGEIQPLGEARPVPVDVRIIAATNAKLEDAVAAQRFREDLYYRLNIIRLRVPPLRERRVEVPAIVHYYLEYYASKCGRTNLRITAQTLDLLMVSEWPGNVRQLCNEVQRIVARAEDHQVITPDDLSPELRHTAATTTASVPPTSYLPSSSLAPATLPALTIHEDTADAHVTLSDALGALERRLIAEALSKHAGNISRAAGELGVTRRGLYLKLERYTAAR